MYVIIRCIALCRWVYILDLVYIGFGIYMVLGDSTIICGYDVSEYNCIYLVFLKLYCHTLFGG